MAQGRRIPPLATSLDMDKDGWIGLCTKSRELLKSETEVVLI